MSTRLGRRAAVLVGAAMLPLAVHAQVKSRAKGFYIGAGIEGAGIKSDNRPDESGGGAALVLGYGLNPSLSLYTQVSGAGMTSKGGGDYGLAHWDLGVRLHFRSGRNIVVPFIDAALTGRSIDGNPQVGSARANVKASGGGLTIGAGINAHFTPNVALSVALSSTGGDFRDYTIDGNPVTGGAVSATTTRAHIGLIWFPNYP